MEQNEVAERVFKEMDKEKEVVNEGMNIPDKKLLRKELLEIVARRKDLSHQRKLLTQEMLSLGERGRELRKQLTVLPTERKPRSTEAKNLSPDQKRVQQAKNKLVHSMEKISHFRDQDDLREQCFERAKNHFGLDATQKAVEDLKEEGRW
jgi:hypothetical protein